MLTPAGQRILRLDRVDARIARLRLTHFAAVVDAHFGTFLWSRFAKYTRKL